MDIPHYVVYMSTTRKMRGKKKGQKRPFVTDRQTVVRSFDRVMPDRTEVELVWNVAEQLANAGNAYASLRFIMNGAWDPDPRLGGLSFTGLAQMSALYIYYRPVWARYRLTVSNKEAFPLMVYTYCTNSDPGATVGVNGSIFSQQKFGQRKMMSAVSGGSSTVTFNGTVPFSSLLGSSRSLEDEDNYRGLTGSTNPADLFYIGFNTDAVGVLQTAAGTTFDLMLTVRVRFYDRLTIV